MPLEPGERYTAVEVDIMKQLGNTKNRLDLYELLRKTKTNPNILLAVGGVKVHKFSLMSEDNQIEKFEGYLLMEDVQSFNRDLDKEEENVINIHDGAFRFGLGKVIDGQIHTQKLETFVFDINTCGIDIISTNSQEFEKLKENFNEFVRKNRPADPIQKRYLLFPVYYRCEVYLTLVVNPSSAVKMNYGGYLDRECVMYHIGTTDLTLYKKEFVPRIIKILENFVEMFAPAEGYAKLMEEKIEVREKVLPNIPYCEKPFQLLYLVDKLLGKRNSVRNWEATLAEVGNDEEKMLAEMKDLRNSLAVVMNNTIGVGTDPVGKHLLGKRRQIGEYQKAQREKEAAVKKEDEDGDDDEDNGEPATKVAKVDKKEPVE